MTLLYFFHFIDLFGYLENMNKLLVHIKSGVGFYICNQHKLFEWFEPYHFFCSAFDMMDIFSAQLVDNNGHHKKQLLVIILTTTIIPILPLLLGLIIYYMRRRRFKSSGNFFSSLSFISQNLSWDYWINKQTIKALSH